MIYWPPSPLGLLRWSRRLPLMSSVVCCCFSLLKLCCYLTYASSPPFLPWVTMLFFFSAILAQRGRSDDYDDVVVFTVMPWKAKPNMTQLCNFFLSLSLRSLALQTCFNSIPVNDCDEWNYEAFIFVYCSVLPSSWLANGSTKFLFHPFPSCLWLRSILNSRKMKYKALIGQSCLL